MSELTIWVTGASGRIGTQLVKELEKDVENKVIATDMDVDITDLEEVNNRINIYRPNVVINCASISDKKSCEDDYVKAYRVNALGARNLAIASRRMNAKIIHLSTDDVYDGEISRGVTEFDIPKPKSVYGKSKLAGENYIRELNPKHLIVRSSWVYGTGNANDFWSRVLENGKNNVSFAEPVDEIGSPTSVEELTKFILYLIHSSEYGIYHASCEGVCTRFQFGRAILEEMGYDKSIITETYMNDYGQGSEISLDNLMMKLTNEYQMIPWRDALKNYVKKIKE